MTTVVCPPSGGQTLPDELLMLAGAVVLPPVDDSQWIPRTALALHQVPGRVRLVAYGQACDLVPHVGFAARAARRPVSQYVLVDGPIPEAGRASDWPDAPVVVVCDESSETARAARLRGFAVFPAVPDDEPM